MSKLVLWIILVFISVVILSVILSGCLLGPGFQIITSQASVSGYIYGITSGATITVKDDLGQTTTALQEYNRNYYSLSVSPGVRTLTYACTGYTTVSTKISVIGQITVNITMKPLAGGGIL